MSANDQTGPDEAGVSEPFLHGYNRTTADAIIAALESKPLGLGKICEQVGGVSRSRVHLWIRDDVDGFQDRYVRAKEVGLESLAEQIVTISDDGTNDFTETDDGAPVVNYDHIARSKLRVDSRKWLLSKLLPKKYGDRISQEISGPDGKPIETITRTDDEAVKFAALLAAANRKVGE